jgi:hypothetical protein
MPLTGDGVRPCGRAGEATRATKLAAIGGEGGVSVWVMSR